jgi:hypothetical protein
MEGSAMNDIREILMKFWAIGIAGVGAFAVTTFVMNRM